MWDMALTFAILAVTIVLFVSDLLRLDLVAILALLALMLTGLVGVDEALAGFSNSTVIVIAGLFVVGAGLFYTGVADLLGRWMADRAGTDEVRIIGLIMLICALLSAFMSSTGAVAVLLPVVVSLARDAKTSPSKLLIPLAFGALMGGMLTLIGTPPNLVVNAQLLEQGYTPFGFFSFTPVGAAVLLVGIVFMVLIGRRLLPARRRLRFMPGRPPPTTAELSAYYAADRDNVRLRVRRASLLVGKTLAESDLGLRYGLHVLEIQAWPNDDEPPLVPEAPRGDRVLDPHDILLVHGPAEAVARACRELDLGRRPEAEGRRRLSPKEVGMAEVLIRGQSQLIGQTLQQIRFRSRYRVNVVGIMRLGQPVQENLATIPLRFGDTLLVEGTWADIEYLSEDRNNLIVVNQPRELAERLHTPRNALVAGTIVLAMLALMTLGLVPTVTAVLLAAAAMILAGCVPIDDVYNVINWQSIILIAAMLPMATALENSGGVQFVADILIGSLGEAGGAYAIMIGLYVITAFFSQFISNTATAVLIAPIAGQIAYDMGLDPHAFLMVVAISASAAFATPIASPVNTLVIGPGDYRFSDFARVGIPLQIVVLVVVLLTVPIFFPV